MGRRVGWVFKPLFSGRENNVRCPNCRPRMPKYTTCFRIISFQLWNPPTISGSGCRRAIPDVFLHLETTTCGIQAGLCATHSDEEWVYWQHECIKPQAENTQLPNATPSWCASSQGTECFSGRTSPLRSEYDGMSWPAWPREQEQPHGVHTLPVWISPRNI